MTDPKLIEAVARAIYDAPLEISGGDTIAEIVHHCEWINDTEPLDAQLAQVREVCGELAQAAITAYETARGDGVVKPDVEIRRNDDGTIDEVVATGVSIHIEQMNKGSWYIGLDGPDDVWQFWLNGKGKVAINGEHSSANRPPEIRRAMIAAAKGE